MMRKVISNAVSNVIIAVAVAAVTFSFWAYFNRPEHEPLWPNIVPGFSFSPMRMHNDPIHGILPTIGEIEEDIALLQGKCHALRTYSVEGVQAEIPALAKKYNLNVALGAWISDDMERNQREIEEVIRLARTHRNVVRIIIGNEALLRGDISPAQLFKYLDYVRKELYLPVSTAEPWHVWIRHVELADHVDYIAAHMLPYWEGVDLGLAVDYVFNCCDMLTKAFPDKPLVISEIGWPSNGRTRRSSVASVANEATFLRRFIDRAEKEKINYYIMEAFDQTWKTNFEGAVGAYWGVYDVNRKPKFSFTEPIVDIPQWHTLAVISIIISVITLALLLMDSHSLKSRGRGFLAVMAYTAATAAVWVVYKYSLQYLNITSITVGILLVIGMIGVITVLLAEAHEWAEAIWFDSRRRPFQPPMITDKNLPMISVHIPTYNEPPDMVIETLDGLAALDYPLYEVIVVDNNTKDPAVWEPVAAYCRKLGPHFRFFHVDPLEGFKAGALNFALRQTHQEAEIIAIIDSDYVVESNWLRDLVPAFENSKIAIIQAPQDYRDEGGSIFKDMCYHEYKGFFFIGMITRNERNAIIQHGTMTMVRRVVLEEVGGWAEWCITEDAELGLRIFNHGYEALYIPKSYGKGLMPDNFLDYKKQRFRWAYGAVRIMKQHAMSLLGLKGKLTKGQRYHYIAGWLSWIADGINLLLNLAAIFWSMAMIIAPKVVDAPMVIFSSFPLAFFIFKAAKLFYLYNALIGTTIMQTLGAALAGLSLSHTIGRAILAGVFTRHATFFRTPKMSKASNVSKAIASAREEILFMAALWLAALTIAFLHETDSPDMLLWIIVLLIQSIPYLATFIVSVISAFPPSSNKVKSIVPASETT
jgi:exo-beta-1,3-glucanase (GH17 family)/cellulose synthase/poly-beta-1,6-N-acetylglucosamine synthase-like glycosyltransferase